jgi:hypothetical protein
MLDEHTGLHDFVVKVQIAFIDHAANLRLGTIATHELAEHNS